MFWRAQSRERPRAAVALSPAMLVLRGVVIAVGTVGKAIHRHSSASPISCRQMPGGCGGLAARRARNASHTAARAVSTWLGEKRRIYPCTSAYTPSCPFLIHRCVPLSSHDYQRRFWCWGTMTQAPWTRAAHRIGTAKILRLRLQDAKSSLSATRLPTSSGGLCCA